MFGLSSLVRNSLRATRSAPLASRHSLRATRFAPLASRRKCTGFVAAIAATSLALLCPRPAAAQDGGTWDFPDSFHSEYKVVNGVKQSYSGPDLPLYRFNHSEDMGMGKVEARINSSTGDAFGSILLKGKDRIIAYWYPPSSASSPPPPGTPPAPEPTPPATVTVQVNSRVSAFFNPASGVSELTPVVQLDNGFGDPATPTTNDLYLSGTGWASEGLHLKTFSTRGIAKDLTYTQGTRYKLELPLDINLSAAMTASEGGYYPYQYSAGLVQARLGDLYATGDSRMVRIDSSTIEPNYYKHYYAGAWVGEPQFADPTGAKVTDVGLDINDNGSYVFDGFMYAYAYNFVNPGYVWQYSGPGQYNFGPTPGDNTGLNGSDYSRRWLHLNLGQNDSDIVDKESTVTLKVTDKPGLVYGGGDGAKGENTLKIRWHRTVDNLVADESKRTETKTMRQNVVTALPPNAKQEYMPADASVSWSLGTKAGSAVLDIVSGVVDVKGIGNKVGVQTLIAATKYKIGAIEPKPTDVKNTWDKWTQAIKTQQDINAAKATNVELDDNTQRLFPASMANSTDYNKGHTDSWTDKDYQDSKMDLWIARKTITQGFDADTYGLHGYEGPGSGSVTWPVDYEVHIFRSMFTGTTPGSSTPTPTP